MSQKKDMNIEELYIEKCRAKERNWRGSAASEMGGLSARMGGFCGIPRFSSSLRKLHMLVKDLNAMVLITSTSLIIATGRETGRPQEVLIQDYLVWQRHQ